MIRQHPRLPDVRRPVAALLLTLWLLPSGPAWAATGTSRVSGVLTDQQGNAIAGAKVVMGSLEKPGSAASTVTDQAGRYSLDGLTYGHYNVAFEVLGKGYPANRVLTVPPRRRVEANFQLGDFRPDDAQLGLTAGGKVALLDLPAAGIARLEERLGPSGWAWFSTGKGVAVLVAGGAAVVAGLIALSSGDNNKSSNPSPSSN